MFLWHQLDIKIAGIFVVKIGCPDTEMIYDLVNQLQSYSNINSIKLEF